MEWITSLEAWIALATLVSLEVVLGIDNIIFITILVGKLPRHQQDRGRIFGLLLAMLTRIMLLLSLFLIMKLTSPLFSILGNDFSGRDLILIIGGLFLIYKATSEIHSSFHQEETERNIVSTGNFWGVLIQIAVSDLVFSLDSVITAVGMANDIGVMILAIIIAVLVMMFASKVISDFVQENPTIKMLALSFLILVGVSLVVEGFDFSVPKGYIYFAMAFSLAVESLNIYASKKCFDKRK